MTFKPSGKVYTVNGHYTVDNRKYSSAPKGWGVLIITAIILLVLMVGLIVFTGSMAPCLSAC